MNEIFSIYLVSMRMCRVVVVKTFGSLYTISQRLFALSQQQSQQDKSYQERDSVVNGLCKVIL